MNDRPVFRFAPSPNGELHLGHAYSALYTARAAREAGGRFLLRIEDIDLLRARREFAERIFEDLAWLGLEWEQPVRRQSAHFAEYAAALERLRQEGLVYPCFATRRQIRDSIAGKPGHPRDPEGSPLYPGLSKSLSEAERAALLAEGRPHAFRLDMDKACRRAREIAGGPLEFLEEGAGPGGERGRLAVRPGLWGDVIVARKDIGTSYHLAVVVDDARQGVTHVSRGQDLFHATHIHRLLQVLLGLPAPVYRHHALIREGESGRKLSKSARDRSLRALRESGVAAAEIRRTLGFGS